MSHNERNFLRRGPGETVSLTVEETQVIFIAEKNGQRASVTEYFDYNFQAVDRFDEMVLIARLDYDFRVDIVEHL